MHLRQTCLKAKAAFKYWRITHSVFRIIILERLCKVLVQINSEKLPLFKPLGIVIRVTERCFLRCKMCGQNSENGRLKDVHARNRQTIDPKVMESMVNEIRSWPFKPFIKLTGGEPLIEWKMLRPFLVKLRKMGCVIKLNTNAVLIKNRQLAREIVETGIDYLSISIDGTKDIHNQIRGFSSVFDNAKKGVQNINKERKVQGSKYPMVLISSVVSTLNEYDVVNMSELANEWEVDWLNIQFLNFLTPERSDQAYKVLSKCFGTSETPWTGFELNELTNVDVNHLSKTINIIKRTARCPVSVMRIGNSPKALKKFHYTNEVITNHICHMPFATMFIVPQSYPVFCIDYPYYIYGDLNKQSIEESWFGRKAQLFRHSFVQYYKKHGKNFPQCLRCNWPFNS